MQQAITATRASLDTHRGIRDRIACADVEQQRGEHAAERECAEQPDGDAAEGPGHAALQHVAKIWARAAPIAMRTPISCVRWATENESTP